MAQIQEPRIFRSKVVSEKTFNMLFSNDISQNFLEQSVLCQGDTNHVLENICCITYFSICAQGLWKSQLKVYHLRGVNFDVLYLKSNFCCHLKSINANFFCDHFNIVHNNDNCNRHIFLFWGKTEVYKVLILSRQCLTSLFQ